MSSESKRAAEEKKKIEAKMKEAAEQKEKEALLKRVFDEMGDVPVRGK